MSASSASDLSRFKHCCELPAQNKVYTFTLKSLIISVILGNY